MAKQVRAEDTTVVWTPRSAPQRALIACPIFEVFFGGSRGSLKTDSMIGDWIRHSSLYGEHAAGLMVRREREELKATIKRFKQVLTPLGFTFAGYECRGPTGSHLTFAYLDHDDDAEHYQGWNLTRVYVEEIGNFPDQGPVMKLMATLRSVEGVPVGFRSTGNPGGPGHGWVKARYISPAPQGWEILTEDFENPFTGETKTMERMFLPGKITDHDLLGSDYIAQLQMQGSEALVRAWLLGDWDVVEGAFFDRWSDRMVIAPFTIPDHWLRFISGDWGYAAPFSFGWWAVASEDYHHESGVIPKGALVRYREWYGVAKDRHGAVRPNVGVRMDAEEVGPELLKRSDGEELVPGVLDPAMFATQSGPSIAERIHVSTDYKLTFRAADNTRVGKRGALGGWDQMRGRMVGVEGRPMIYAFFTCTESVRTIPVLQHDENRPEDLDTESEDHAADEWRYACMSRPYTRPQPGHPKPVYPYVGTNGGSNIVGNVPIIELIRQKERARANE